MKKQTKPYVLGANSQRALQGVHPKLKELISEMLWYRDFSIIEGLRTLETQKAYVAKGVSKTLNSKHLARPDGFSRAVDIWPYPVPRTANGQIDSNSKDWDQLACTAFYCAGKLNLESLEWGGLWKSFVDKPHFEIGE